MEKNKEFLDFISVCYDKIHIDKEVYEILSKTSIDLREYFQEFMGMFHTKDDYSTMIKCMEQVIKNKSSDKDCDDYLLEYKGYVRDCFKVIPRWEREVRTLKNLYETLKISDLELCDGFDNAKVLIFDSMKFRYNGITHTIAKGKKEFCIKINDSETNIGGILVRNGKAKFISTDYIEDEMKLLTDILARKDYNIALMPRFSILEKNKIKNSGIEGLTNKEFFDLRYIIENGVVYNNKNILEDYEYIRNHKIKIGSLFNILDSELNYDIVVKLLRVILEKIEDFEKEKNEFEKEKNEFEKLYEHIKNILEQRVKSNYLYTITLNDDLTKTIEILSNKELEIEEFLRVLKNGDIGRNGYTNENDIILIGLDKKIRRLKKNSKKLEEIIKENRYLFMSSNTQFLDISKEI